MLRPSFSQGLKDTATKLDVLIAQKKAHRSVNHLIGTLDRFIKASEVLRASGKMKADYVPISAVDLLWNLRLLSCAKTAPYFKRRAAVQMESRKQ